MLKTDPPAVEALDAIAKLDWSYAMLGKAAEDLSNHVAQRGPLERSAMESLMAPGSDGKSKTQTWASANLDLDAAFANWRKERTEKERYLIVCQGEVEVAKLKSKLALILMEAK